MGSWRQVRGQPSPVRLRSFCWRPCAIAARLACRAACRVACRACPAAFALPHLPRWLPRTTRTRPLPPPAQLAARCWTGAAPTTMWCATLSGCSAGSGRRWRASSAPPRSRRHSWTRWLSGWRWRCSWSCLPGLTASSWPCSRVGGGPGWCWRWLAGPGSLAGLAGPGWAWLVGWLAHRMAGRLPGLAGSGAAVRGASWGAVCPLPSMGQAPC
jgi:hypothetical protein